MNEFAAGLLLGSVIAVVVVVVVASLEIYLEDRRNK